LTRREKRTPDYITAPILARAGGRLAGRLAPATVYGHAIEVRNFFAYLETMGYLLTDPIEDLDALDVTENLALRLSEGLSLTMADLDLRERTLLVRNGKGGKDRYVPFSHTALAFLQKYLDEERLRLMKGDPLLKPWRQPILKRQAGQFTAFVIPARRIFRKQGPTCVPSRNSSGTRALKPLPAIPTFSLTASSGCSKATTPGRTNSTEKLTTSTARRPESSRKN